MRHTIIAALALATVALAATPTFAAEARMAWNDLDLSTEAGRTELDHRIDAVAAQVCSDGPVTGTRIARKPSKSCLGEARAAITAQIAAKTGNNRVASNAR